MTWAGAAPARPALGASRTGWPHTSPAWSSSPVPQPIPATARPRPVASALNPTLTPLAPRSTAWCTVLPRPLPNTYPPLPTCEASTPAPALPPPEVGRIQPATALTIPTRAHVRRIQARSRPRQPGSSEGPAHQTPASAPIQSLPACSATAARSRPQRRNHPPGRPARPDRLPRLTAPLSRSRALSGSRRSPPSNATGIARAESQRTP